MKFFIVLPFSFFLLLGSFSYAQQVSSLATHKVPLSQRLREIQNQEKQKDLAHKKFLDERNPHVDKIYNALYSDILTEAKRQSLLETENRYFKPLVAANPGREKEVMKVISNSIIPEITSLINFDKSTVRAVLFNTLSLEELKNLSSVYDLPAYRKLQEKTPTGFCATLNQPSNLLPNSCLYELNAEKRREEFKKYLNPEETQQLKDTIVAATPAWQKFSHALVRTLKNITVRKNPDDIFLARKGLNMIYAMKAAFKKQNLNWVNPVNIPRQ